ncbi:transcription termination/antitermination NusG family protein [Rhizobium sp. WW_1]|jgi:transcriptional antiterminator NusG|uniref:transcription termination/antitermination protein NusG n=1 Tax=Rhizobium sp. WW_1 TaxID=1907375 RepID=UPI000645C75F|nr:transcription termination/antitermination NusG family protein [Rhizobium sp. WW_1]RKD61674.1 transcriptional antiterminator NusG [Rhizobium sp. WW_1]
MTMQHKRDSISGAPLDIRQFASDKQDTAISLHRIRIREIVAASKRVADENPDLAGWYCLHVLTGRETSVEKALTDDKVECLLLREPEQTVMRRGRLWRFPGRLWLPGFALVRCVPSNEAFRGLLGIQHVTEIVGGWARPYRVSDESISQFNAVMQEKEEERVRQRLAQEFKNATIAPGDKVRITLGPFSGIEAKVLKKLKGREKRCKVEYRLMGQTGQLNTPLANLQKL